MVCEPARLQMAGCPWDVLGGRIIATYLPRECMGTKGWSQTGLFAGKISFISPPAGFLPATSQLCVSMAFLRLFLFGHPPFPSPGSAGFFSCWKSLHYDTMCISYCGLGGDVCSATETACRCLTMCLVLIISLMTCFMDRPCVPDSNSLIHIEIMIFMFAIARAYRSMRSLYELFSHLQHYSTLWALVSLEIFLHNFLSLATSHNPLIQSLIWLLINSIAYGFHKQGKEQAQDRKRCKRQVINRAYLS